MIVTETTFEDEGTELEDYQLWVDTTSAARGLEWATMGLAAEAGEVAGALEKFIRNGAPEDDFDKMREAMKLELGDVLWYVAEICNELCLTMDEVIDDNIEKINIRRSRQQVGEVA